MHDSEEDTSNTMHSHSGFRSFKPPVLAKPPTDQTLISSPQPLLHMRGDPGRSGDAHRRGIASGRVAEITDAYLHEGIVDM